MATQHDIAIRRARVRLLKAHGLTQQQIALELDVDLTTIRRDCHANGVRDREDAEAIHAHIRQERLSLAGALLEKVLHNFDDIDAYQAARLLIAADANLLKALGMDKVEPQVGASAVEQGLIGFENWKAQQIAQDTSEGETRASVNPDAS